MRSGASANASDAFSRISRRMAPYLILELIHICHQPCCCAMHPIGRRSVTFSFTDPSKGNAVTAMCPGGTYSISIKFPNKRLAMMSANAGYMGSDKRW